MKKFIALLLVPVLLVSLAACSSQKLTMQELIDANQPQALLESYDSVYIRSTMDAEVYGMYYLTDDYCYESNESGSMYLTNDTGYMYSNGTYQHLVFLTPDGLASYADYRTAKYADVLFSKESRQEKIQSITETEDQITVVCATNQKKLEKIIGRDGLHSLETTYVLDAQTYGLISATALLTYDEEKTLELTMECAYNTEAPEEMKAFLEYANQTQDLRTITMVFQSGTDQEKTETIQSPKGLPIGLGMPMGSKESFSIYADAACTLPYESNGDFTSDVTIYIK